MSTRIGVAVMVGALALYLVLVAQRAVLLIASGDPIAIAMGVALVVLPIVGAWAVAREVLFGFQAAALGRRLEVEGDLPEERVHVHPSGRVLRDDADAVFPVYRREVEQSPDDWQAWYRLGLAYDAAGDRRRAREAVRRAIRIDRMGRSSAR